MRIAFLNSKPQGLCMDPKVAPNPQKASPAASRVLVVAAIAGMTVLFLFNPATTAIYPPCPLHRLTGLLCPGCGSLRAIHELLHGNVTAAFHLNALLVLSLPAVIALMARSLYRKLRGQPGSIGISGKAFWAGLVIVILFGIIRNFWRPFPF